MKEKIRDQIYALLQETIDDDSVVIRDDSDIVNELELSSLEVSEMLVEMEAEYGIRITNAMLRQMTNVAGIINIVTDCVAKVNQNG